MNLAELNKLMAQHGPTGTLADVAREADRAATVVEAMAQRMVTVPPSYDFEGEAAECACGLLLSELPTSTPPTVRRTILVLGKPREQMHRLTHAHIAPGLCVECWDTDSPCAHHPAVMCHTPDPELCWKCQDAPAALGEEQCRTCLHEADGPEWDPDRYYGTE
jgi:hypothetical protein